MLIHPPSLFDQIETPDGKKHPIVGKFAKSISLCPNLSCPGGTKAFLGVDNVPMTNNINSPCCCSCSWLFRCYWSGLSCCRWWAAASPRCCSSCCSQSWTWTGWWLQKHGDYNLCYSRQRIWFCYPSNSCYSLSWIWTGGWVSGWLRQKRSWDSGWLLAPEWAPVKDEEEEQFWNIWETRRKGDIGRLDKKFCMWWRQSQELPRTGKRLVDVGCFLPTLERERVTGWLDENDVSWKDTSLNLDVVFIFGLSLDTSFYIWCLILFLSDPSPIIGNACQ